jgi:uncharacterized membrane protein
MWGIGRNAYGLGAILLGVVGLVSGDFASVWQPVPDALPGRRELAYVAAAAFLLAGLAIQWRRTARWGALGLIALYGAVVFLVHVPRVMIHPFQFSPWTGLAEQLAAFAGGVAALSLEPNTPAAPRLGRLARILFGACLISFAAAHFVYLKETASLVPAWLPPNRTFWAWATGAAHLAAAIAILADVVPLLAAQALTMMFVVFGLLVHIPSLIHDPKNHMNWAANAVNLTLIGAAWVIADMLAKGRKAKA